MIYSLIVASMIVAAVISAALSVYCWRRRHAAEGAVSFALLMLAITEWLLADIKCLLSTTLAAKLLWAKIEYIGIVSIPVIWLVFALQHTHQQKWLTRRQLALLAIIPALTLLLVWTNEAHGLIWTKYSLYQVGSIVLSKKAYGAWFWGPHVVYSYLLMILGAGLLIPSAISSIQLYRRRAIAIAIALVVPAVGNMIYISGLSPVPGMDLTPLSFIVAGIMLSLALFRFNLLDIVPIAHKAAIEGMNDGLIILDPQNRIIEMNPAAGHIIGVERSKIIGEQIGQVLCCWPKLNRPQNEATNVRADITLTVDGEEHCYDTYVSLLRDWQGTIKAKMITLHDITEKKRYEEALRESERRFRELADFLPQMVFEIDKEGFLTFVNRNSFNMFGYTPEDFAKGINILQMFVLEDRSKVGKQIEQVLQGEHQGPKEYRALKKDGSVFPVLVEFSPIVYEGESVGLRGITIDITQQKQMAEKLRELYQREGKLRRELEKKIKERAEFTWMLVHELKTPLTPVLNSSELLVNELKEEILLRLARSVYRGANNLNKRVNELLDLAKEEMGILQLRPGPVEPRQLLQKIVEDIALVVSRHEQRLFLELPPSLPTIWADEDRLQQIVLNLLDNAVKFTPRGGKITLRAREEGSFLVVEVQDTGCGITEEEKQRLFEPYHREGLNKKERSGLGLGLILAKKLVELHGGRIWLESQEGLGSTFAFAIPLKEPSENQKC